jgi:hypothetical protein
VGSTPRVNAAPLVFGGVLLGAMAGMVGGASMASWSAPELDLALLGIALIGGTVGAASGLFLGGIGAIIMRLLESQPRGVVTTAVGAVVGLATLAILLSLGHTQEAAQSAVPTAGVLGLVAAGLAWWSCRRSADDHGNALHGRESTSDATRDGGRNPGR